MRRTIALFLCLLVFSSCFVLTACGGTGKDLSESKYVGTWKCENLSLKEESAELESEWIITLNPDGTAQSVSDEEVQNCNWTETGDGFKLTGDLKLTFKDEGDGVKTKVIGVELHFVKQ